ncbi:MAG: hypothetical protein AB7R00_32035 [Kofleriaceae bacterium]
MLKLAQALKFASPVNLHSKVNVAGSFAGTMLNVIATLVVLTVLPFVGAPLNVNEGP